MKRYLLCLLIMFVFLMLGCHTGRQFSIDLAEEEVENAKAIREVSKRLIQAWPTISGFVRGILGDDINQLPVSVLKSMDELDKLSEQTEWSENDLGRIAGLRIKLCSEYFRHVIQRYAPDLLIYLI